MPKPKESEETCHLGCRIPVSLRDQIDETAARTLRDRTHMVILLLSEALAARASLPTNH